MRIPSLAIPVLSKVLIRGLKNLGGKILRFLIKEAASYLIYRKCQWLCFSIRTNDRTNFANMLSIRTLQKINFKPMHCLLDQAQYQKF